MYTKCSTKVCSENFPFIRDSNPNHFPEGMISRSRTIFTAFESIGIFAFPRLSIKHYIKVDGEILTYISAPVKIHNA